MRVFSNNVYTHGTKPALIPRESQTHTLNLFTLKSTSNKKKIKLKTLNIKLTFD